MIGKIFNISYKNTASIQDEMDHHKRKSSDENGHKKGREFKEENKLNTEDEILTEVTIDELSSWIKELNSLVFYANNDLTFNISLERKEPSIILLDKNKHQLHEYLPVQFKTLYLQLKKDNSDSKKGTILNLSC